VNLAQDCIQCVQCPMADFFIGGIEVLESAHGLHNNYF
jgi:hypothetical protein